MAKCLYCGNNPVPHGFTKVNDFFRPYFDRLNEKTRAWRIRSGIENSVGSLTLFLIEKFENKNFLNFRNSTEVIEKSRNKVLWLAAIERGILMEELYMGNRPLNYYRANLGGRLIYFDGFPIPENKDISTEEKLNNKAWLKNVLQGHGVPVPRGSSFHISEWPKAVELFEKLEKPVIIKPSNGSRGRHTTTFIYTVDQLKEAFKILKEIAHYFVMEEHLIGSVYRGTVVDGKLVGALRGDPPRITGDGVLTIKELIDKKNLNKHPKVKEVEIDKKMIEFLSRTGYSPESILEKDKTIDISEKIGIGYGGYKAEEIHITHPKVKEALVKAGKVVNYPIMGFDFIIEDITKDPDTQKWGIIECNSLPFIDLHFEPLEGPSINVGRDIWDMWN